MPDNNVDRAVGRLEGQMEQVLAMLQTSAVNRQQLYEGQEQLRIELQAVGRRVEDISATVSKVEPVASEFNKWKERGVGIVALLGLVWLFFGGLVVRGVESAVSWLIKLMS